MTIFPNPSKSILNIDLQENNNGQKQVLLLTATGL